MSNRGGEGMNLQETNEYFSIPSNRSALLQYYANQYGDFKVARHIKEDLWTKHFSVISICESGKMELLQHSNNRQLLSNEIVIDLDYLENETKSLFEERAKKIIQVLTESFTVRVYFSGSKGYHIHIMYNEHLDKDTFRLCKNNILTKFNGDLHKASFKSLIALEFCPHWKTNQLKTLIVDNTKGLYYEFSR